MKCQVKKVFKMNSKRCVCFGVFVVASTYLCGVIDAICCRHTEIKFINNAWPRMDCNSFKARQLETGNHCGIDQRKLCAAYVCEHGKPPGKGFYCGNGPCNLFGCDCDDGCIGGDLLYEFKSIHGSEVTIPDDECFSRSRFGNADQIFDSLMMKISRINRKKNCKNRHIRTS